MTDEDTETQILMDLFKQTLENVIENRKDDLKLSENELDLFRKAYSYLFAMVYANRWADEQDDLVQQVDDFIQELIGGD